MLDAYKTAGSSPPAIISKGMAVVTILTGPISPETLLRIEREYCATHLLQPLDDGEGCR